MKKKIFLDGPRATRSLIKKKKRWGSGDENGASYCYHIINQLAFVTRNILFNCLRGTVNNSCCCCKMIHGFKHGNTADVHLGLLQAKNYS